jgi:hypothetical protein
VLAGAELRRRAGQDPLLAGQIVLDLRDLGHAAGDLGQERHIEVSPIRHHPVISCRIV